MHLFQQHNINVIKVKWLELSTLGNIWSQIPQIFNSQKKKKSLSFKKWVDQTGPWAIMYLLQHEATSLGYISGPYIGNSCSFCVKYLARDGRIFFSISKLTHSGCMPQWACCLATLHRKRQCGSPSCPDIKMRRVHHQGTLYQPWIFQRAFTERVNETDESPENNHPYTFPS